MSGIQMSNIKTFPKEPTSEDDFLKELKTQNPEELSEFQRQREMIDEFDDIFSEEFDMTGDESMVRVMKMFDDYNKETEGYLQKIQTREVEMSSMETKTGELPAEPEVGDISDLFESKVLTKRTSFLSRQLKKFREWRARNKGNPEISDELDGDDVFGDLDKMEEEFKSFNNQTDLEVNEMMGESKQIEMTPRGNPSEITPEEADLFDDLNIWGETKSSGNLEAFGEGKLPPEISQSGFSAEELGVEMSGDDFIISEGGQALDLTGVEGEEMLGRIASIVSTNAETAGAVSRGLSMAGDALGVVGIGLAVGSTIYQIYDGISTENKYEEAGDTYVAMGGDITKINKALRENYNRSAKQMNAYTQLYHKWVFQKNDPTQEDKGRQMPLFNYSSNFDSITTDERMDKISTYMISSVIQKQQRDLSKMAPAMRIGLQTLYNQQNERLKKNIIEGLDRVSQGAVNTRWDWLKNMIGTDPDSASDLMSVDVDAQKAGGIKLKAIYDAYREMDLRNKFMTKAYNLTADTKEAQDERFELNTMDNRMLGHFEDQTNQDPAFQTALQARTDEINKNFKFRVDREYAKHFQDINVKWKKSEDAVRTMPLPEANKAQIIKSYEEKRKEEWNVWNRKKQKAYGTEISREQVAQNNYPKKYQFMIDLKKAKPYWIEYYKKNKQKYYDADMNEILSNRKQWLEGTDKTKTGGSGDAPPPYTGDDDSGDYNPFINPKKDIKRKLNPDWKPPKPVVPTPAQPDEPVKPKPPPLPPAPKRRKPLRKLLGATDFDFEPEKDNEFDDEVGFDVNMALHMLHLCEHSYKPFEKYSLQPKQDTFYYDVIRTMGSEDFAVSEQGRMYYSRTDNVISIAYRGTDFGRITTGRPDLFVADLVQDLAADKTNYEGLLLHQGFLNFFLSTQDQVMDFINTYINKDTLIYTTGHSYGAPPSVLLAYMLNKHYGERRAINYNFGSPRGMDRASSKIVATQLTSFRVADIHDPIPLLPPSSMNFFHAGRTIYLHEEEMKEIIDAEEADRLYNIAGTTVAKQGLIAVMIAGIKTLILDLPTTEQIPLATRLGNLLYNTVVPAGGVMGLYENIKQFALFGMYSIGMITNPRVGRNADMDMRPTRARAQRMNPLTALQVLQRDTIVSRFTSRYPGIDRYLNKDIQIDSFSTPENWSTLMESEGLPVGSAGRWHKNLVNRIVEAGIAPKEALEGFLLQMEMMSFPEAVAEYQEFMKSRRMGWLLPIFPNKIALRSAALTVGGLFGLYHIINGIYQTVSFVQLNKHSLEKYDALLQEHTHREIKNGSNVRTEKEMLGGGDAVKDGDGKFYSKTDTEHNGTPIFTQTDNDHLKFMPKYHRDTGLTMMPIPHDLRGAIIGFTILSEEQYNSPNPIKGLMVY